MPTTTRTPWVIVPAPNAAARLRLLCFPYAGSGPSVFASWPRALPSDVEVCAVQMPGRERRLSEPPITDWDEAVERIVDGLRPWTGRPCALFGHSLGAIVAFEVARHLQRQARSGLVHLFVSGCRAPHLPFGDAAIHHLADEAFVGELKRLEGTPEALFESPELLELFLPLLRADLRLAETYACREGAPLGVPISAYAGLEDTQDTPARVAEWRAHTTSAFLAVTFSGGHFFVKEQRAAVLSQVSRELQRITAPL
jgi:surfactin synthase thioesterase subunit